jgi:hypothetical protein
VIILNSGKIEMTNALPLPRETKVRHATAMMQRRHFVKMSGHRTNRARAHFVFPRSFPLR